MKLPLMIVSLLFLVACSSALSVKNDSKLNSAVASNDQSTMYGWYKINATTLGFKGEIDPGAYDAFSKLYEPAVKTIIVNSGGGAVDDASKIGLLIHKNSISVIVDGYCLSSCANYFVTAASSVYLLNGLIGYHGNITSCVDISGGIENYILKDVPNPQSISKKILDKTKENITTTIENEKKFYDQIHLPPLYLSQACRPDKGMDNGVVYNYISPSVDSLKLHHVNVIGGSQSGSRKDEYERVFKSKILVQDL
jgi:hypothetical protein